MTVEDLPLLGISNLTVEFAVRDGAIRAVARASLELRAGEVLGIVGESGSGKSVLLRAVLGLIPVNGHVPEGGVAYKGRDVLAMSTAELRELRMREISMVFQDPGAFLNPVFTIGEEIGAFLRISRGASRREARSIATGLLERVGIPDPARRLDAYPHELSGGQKQRVMIAMAIANAPSLLLADEPTTALDVTIQDQILRLLSDLKDEYGMAMVLVSHDIGVVSRMCSRLAVMYAGRIVEVGRVDEVIANPAHPYTQALVDAVPKVGNLSDSLRPLRTIPGAPPDLSIAASGCPFVPRCDRAVAECSSVTMEMIKLGDSRSTACPRSTEAAVKEARRG